MIPAVTTKITGAARTPRNPDDTAESARPSFFAKKHYLTLIPLSFAGGALAAWLEIPTGGMLGAMFAGGGLSLFLSRRYKFDSRLRFAAQIGLGLVTGERITPQIAHQIGALFLPAIAVTLVMLTGCALLAVLLYKTSGWSLTTCLLCASPAGVSQIVSFAEETDADPLVVSVFHTARVVSIVSLYPWIVLPLASYGGWA
jgi:membrane AbrB-like protein